MREGGGRECLCVCVGGGGGGGGGGGVIGKTAQSMQQSVLYLEEGCSH